MPKINTSALTEGMVLASAAKNVDGMLLIPAGGVLTARHLGILQAWGIAEVEIASAQTGAREEGAGPAPGEIGRIADELRASFWELDENHPAAMAVFNAMLQRHSRRLTNQGIA